VNYTYRPRMNYTYRPHTMYCSVQTVVLPAAQHAPLAFVHYQRSFRWTER